MATDTIADLLTRIRNAQRAGHKSVTIPVFKAGKNVLEVLKKEGFIEGYQEKAGALGDFDGIDVLLKYFRTGEPVISRAQRVSTSGQRRYARSDKMPKVNNRLGISILSTSQGVMSDREARKRKIGGEVLAFIA